MYYTFRTSPPATYIPPSSEDMKDAAKNIGLGSYSKDLVADLCNLVAGGTVNPPSTYQQVVRQKVEEILPSADSNGGWKMPKKIESSDGRDYTKSRFEIIEAKTREQMRYHQNVCNFLQAVDLNQFPGGSPLEQAMSLLKLLSKKQGGQSSGDGGEPLPIFSEADRPEGVAEELHDAMEMVDSLNEEELDMIDPKGENHEVVEQDGQRQGHQGLNKLKVAEDLVEGSDKRVMLDISRKLDQFTKLQVRKQTKIEPDPTGEEIHQRPIRHLGELQRVPKTAWALRQENPSYFLYKAVTGQLSVRERVTRNERKQAIFILLDGSGSMNGKKHWKASGVVMNRLKAVISGDAEVWLSVFDTDLTKAERATNPTEARELIKKFMNKNFSGGGTDIAAAVRSAHKMIEETIKSGVALYRPEIVVLTDEDTSINGLKKSELPGTRVHGFAMEVSNKPLVEFARATGGVGIDKF
jgi:hypothetical protein